MTTADITIPCLSGMDAVGVQIRIWIRRSQTRQHLRDLDPGRLDDVGRTEEERRAECRKWFWQA